MKSFKRHIIESSGYQFYNGLPKELKKQVTRSKMGDDPFIRILSSDQSVQDWIIDEMGDLKNWGYQSIDIYSGGSFHDYWEYAVFHKDDNGKFPLTLEAAHKIASQLEDNVAAAFKNSRRY